MARTLTGAVKLVADEFMTTIKDEGFANFQEMKDCYWWTSDDIKEEVSYILAADSTSIEDWTVYDDGQDVGSSNDFVSYRQFMNMVYKTLKENKMY